MCGWSWPLITFHDHWELDTHQLDLLKWEKRGFPCVQWLGLRAFTAEGAGSISGQGTEIPPVTQGVAQKVKIKILWDKDKKF